MKTKHIFLYSFLLFAPFYGISQTSPNLRFYQKNYTDSEHEGGYERILIITTGNNVRALYNSYFDTMGGRMSCLIGQINRSKITGTSFVFLSNEGGEFLGIEEQKFKIDFSTDKSKIKYYVDNTFSKDCSDLVLSDLKYSFSGDISDFRELPNMKSRILSKVDPAKIRIELLDIGNFEKEVEIPDFWYKVRINGVVGWIFGGLNLDKN